MLALALATAACKGSTPAPSGGTASSAELRARDGGPTELVLGEHALALDAAELPDAPRPQVMQDESGKRLAYVRRAGDVRFVYVVGGGLYVGPSAKAPIDFGAAPDLDHALGDLFETAGTRRAQLVADVAKDKGDAGVVRMLVDGAGTDGREWDEAFAKLPDARAAEVKTALAALLEKGKPTAGLKRAVVVAPLREPARAPMLAARIRELVDPVREPRAIGVMLRALASNDKAAAAQIGCDVLGRKPTDEVLVESALLAVAAAGTDCANAATFLGDEVCVPSVRCNDQGPLTGRETTKQDEPLCTKEQIAKAIEKELARAPADALASASGTRPQLFAYGAVMNAGKVPAAVQQAHTRRRYAVAQPSTPECESGVAPGTACHCEEAILRDQACRHPEGNTVSVGVCKFDIDDKQKKLLNVVATLPP
ncbi:MAG: hypothetical protein JWP87_5430 [Labilithrix sp.]|nr:hypothetical protein [Labilithrix sp.]